MPERLRKLLRGLVILLLVAVVAVVLVFTLWLQVLRVTGDGMEPTLLDGDLVVAVDVEQAQVGDIIAFYHEDHILLKRVVAVAGQSVDMDTQGTLYIDGSPVEEPYLTQRAAGDWTTPLPCTVPAGTVFVLSDARENSTDSRNALVGCIVSNQIIGKMVFRLWPLRAIGPIH